jgi:hypothetical protein
MAIRKSDYHRVQKVRMDYIEYAADLVLSGRCDSYLGLRVLRALNRLDDVIAEMLPEFTEIVSDAAEGWPENPVLESRQNGHTIVTWRA